MLFNQRQKRIRLSNKLGWGVRRGVLPRTKYWIFGSLAFVVALVLIVSTITSSTPPDGEVLGESTTEASPESVTPSLEFIDYTVQAEDTLFNISQQFGTPWTAIAQLNGLEPPFNIRPGQIIKVPIEK